MSITTELLDRLRDHYIEPGATLPGGVFAAEVGNNGDWGKGRRCDALYAGFTSQSGRILIGHEVKISRADWNHERENLGKADQWADQCHAWYLVAPSTAIIPADEVPPGWGLMVPNPRAKRRFQIVVKAHLHPERNPSWAAVRSFMARMDTLREKHMERAIREQVERRCKEIEARWATAATNTAELNELASLKRVQANIEKALGVQIGEWDNTWNNRVSPETLALALRLAQAAKKLSGPHHAGGLSGLMHSLDSAAESIAQARTSADELHAHVKEQA